MKATTKVMLKAAIEQCEEEDRSIEYTLQFMQDYAGVDFDCAFNFFKKDSDQQEKESHKHAPKV